MVLRNIGKIALEKSVLQKIPMLLCRKAIVCVLK